MIVCYYSCFTSGIWATRHYVRLLGPSMKQHASLLGCQPRVSDVRRRMQKTCYASLTVWDLYPRNSMMVKWFACLSCLRLDLDPDTLVSSRAPVCPNSNTGYNNFLKSPRVQTLIHLLTTQITKLIRTKMRCKCDMLDCSKLRMKHIKWFRNWPRLLYLYDDGSDLI